MEQQQQQQKTERTEKQRAASRANGTKSRGPVTPEGKATCARNALRHGLTAFHLALTCEDQESFNMVLADYMDEYRPVDATETNRARLDAKYTHFAEPVQVAEAIESSLARTGSLPHLHRCQSRINREYFQALRMLRAIQKKSAAAFAEIDPTPMPEAAAQARYRTPQSGHPTPDDNPAQDNHEIAETDPAAMPQTATRARNQKPQSGTPSPQDNPAHTDHTTAETVPTPTPKASNQRPPHSSDPTLHNNCAIPETTPENSVPKTAFHGTAASNNRYPRPCDETTSTMTGVTPSSGANYNGGIQWHLQR